MGMLDNGLLGAAGGVAEEMGKTSEAQGNETFNKPFSVERFDSFGGTVSAGEEREIARYRVPAGTQVRWGSGSAKQQANQGFVYGQLKEADGTNVYGILSFQWENATGRRTEVADEVDASDIDTADRYNRDAQPPMPEQTDKRKADQDEYLIVTLEAEADGTIDPATSEVRFPATEYDVSA